MPTDQIFQDIVVGAIDVGKPANVGWAILVGDDVEHGTDLDEFIVRFADTSEGRPSALGFEAPLFLPCRDNWLDMTKQRDGDNGKPWSAGAGANVTTVGIVLMTYTLRKLKPLMEGRPATLDWNNWPDGDSLLVYEAFVSGDNHAGKNEHWKDALTAAEGFRVALPDLDSANAVVANDLISLAGTCLIHSGWCEPSVDLLKQPCLVIRPEAPGNRQPKGKRPNKAKTPLDNSVKDEFEAFIGPLYKGANGKPNLERLFQLAKINGLPDVKAKYGHLNAGQIVMAVRRLLRPLWLQGKLKVGDH